ncbi:MAG: YceI family protein [Bacteroidia bacterium]|nr:YceI family protein [Bacteroidia bacterium]MBT8279606.1 YceI family protein [Bacteroidia bacterium]NND25306.1 YceI family protein [Flavobacteriaceae bacterium]NNK59294.1 YceI family protein [Flavobacteriaceae bacterium]
MKKLISNLVLVLFISLVVVGCKKKADEATTSEAKEVAVTETSAEKYKVNAAESTIEWKGFKPTATHNGTINIENGVFKVDNGMIKSGTFLIDMKSIVVLDLEGKAKSNLESHLMGTVAGKEGDFFNTNQFPSALFEVTGSEVAEGGKTILKGNLDLKGVKNNISFPVSITQEGDMLKINSDAFTIDRTKWGANFGSKSIFDNLGDKFVNDEIELKITVSASKA